MNGNSADRLLHCAGAALVGAALTISGNAQEGGAPPSALRGREIRDDNRAGEPNTRADGCLVDNSVPTPVQDDANLHDVQFLGERTGWAVGDHGVVWRTDDGGQTWSVLTLPVDCSLRSVCFLSDRVGWVAGGATMPFTQLGIGVLLATADGGRTWSDVARGRLPQAYYVRFFSPNEGIVVGEATAEFPTGVIATVDGGKRWVGVEGARHAGWRAAAFASPQIGIAAGIDGAVARIDGKLTGARSGGFGTRGLWDVQFASRDRAWLVGDGGLVLRTENRGVVWESAPAALPEGVAELFDFRTVAVYGDALWIAGSPGSVIWHSPDGGRRWRARSTGQTAPIARIRFRSASCGWAVGAFGSILQTDDGGDTWRAVRGGNRRAALLAIHPRTEAISFSALAQQAAERGYRCVVIVPFRSDDAVRGSATPDSDARLNDAVTAVHGSGGYFGWRFPLLTPGLDRDSGKLIADWMRRTEGRLRAVFYGYLVCQIRLWRPTVILVDRPAVDDAAGNLLADAVVDAVRQAADPTCFIAQRELGALPAWRVSKVFTRLPAGSAGDFLIDSHEALPRVKSSVALFAAAASARLDPLATDLKGQQSFQCVPSFADGAARAAARDFFTGIAIAPGSDARRPRPTIDEEIDPAARAAARRDRNLRAILEQAATSANGGAGVIAALRSASRGADSSTIALQLTMLADRYRAGGQWDQAEAVLVELVERCPNEPATLDAMRWLLQYWTGAEPTYQRLRNLRIESSRLQVDVGAVGERIDRAVSRAVAERREGDADEPALGPDPIRLVSRSEQLAVSEDRSLLDFRLKQQRECGLRMASLIRRKSPAMYRSPDVQLPLASLLRQSGLTALPAERVPGRASDPDATQASAAFDRPTQKTVACKAVHEPPALDGVLSDACWQEAEEIPLSADGSPGAASGTHAFVMLARDDRNLYFAISVPRAARISKDGPMLLGRTHDQDLSRHDRVALSFDVDRDCATWYTIEIDQRGCVSESCWGDFRWNPRMGVAAAADDDRWRIEGAIPFEELVPKSPQPREGWGLAVTRTIPAVRAEGWSRPVTTRPRPDSFGIVRFQ